jgi:putative NADH-flavin reductase
MKLLILGASGPTGIELVKQALAQGDEVTALVRDPSKLKIQDPKLEVRKGNVFDQETVDTAVAGKDAVISALGSPWGLTGAPHTTVYSDSAKVLVLAMRKHGVKRLVYCTSGGVEDHDPNAAWFYEHIIKPMLLQKAYDDMKIGEAVLWGLTDIEWVIVRPTQLVDKPKTEKFRAMPRFAPEHGTQISRADLAFFMLEQTRKNDWVHKTPTLAY